MQNNALRSASILSTSRVLMVVCALAGVMWLGGCSSDSPDSKKAKETESVGSKQANKQEKESGKPKPHNQADQEKLEEYEELHPESETFDVLQ